jgi:DNA helicase-2/ATP-dependent DNA helicase PcrA
VFVPGLAGSRGSSRIFPDNRTAENAVSNSSALPWWLPGRDDEGIPSPGMVGKKTDLDDVLRDRKQAEEWRLFYVACTRAQRRLVCSAGHWYPGPAEPQGPSAFYEFVAQQADIVTERFRHDASDVEPLQARQLRQMAAAAGAATAASVTEDPPQLQFDDVPTPVAAALAADDRAAPSALSVTALVSLARCPKQFWWSVVRPLPRRPSPAARLGTAVHRWIEQRSDRQLTLLEPDPDEPGRVGAWQDSFLATPYADLDPVRVEAPFVLAVAGRLVRGRVDAVYERDGRFEVVDFKTGRPPSAGDPGGRTQIDIYGLAAVEAWRVEAATIRTTYCYLKPDAEPELVTEDCAFAPISRPRPNGCTPATTSRRRARGARAATSSTSARPASGRLLRARQTVCERAALGTNPPC